MTVALRFRQQRSRRRLRFLLSLAVLALVLAVPGWAAATSFHVTGHNGNASATGAPSPASCRVADSREGHQADQPRQRPASKLSPESAGAGQPLDLTRALSTADRDSAQPWDATGELSCQHLVASGLRRAPPAI